MKYSKLTKKLLSLICVWTIICGCIPNICIAEESNAEAFAAILCEDMLTNEIKEAITQNLDLDLGEKLPEGVSVSFESDSNALAVDGEVAHIVRNLYHDTPVVLTATVSDGKNTVTKDLNFTVLKGDVSTHLSENFYYPDNEGKLITDEASIKKSQVTPSPAMTADEGWAFGYKTLFEGDGVDAQRFKAITDKKDNDYVLHGYRDVAVDDDYNHIHYVFGSKPSGIVSIKADVTFDHEPGTQIYVFRSFANYYVNGAYERARVFEINYKYDTNGALSTYNSYYQGTEIKSVNISKDKMPKVGEETEIEWVLDTYAQVWDMYINGEKVTTESVPFYERDKEGTDRRNIVDINDIDFNIFRTFEGGNVYIDDLLVTSTKKNDESRFNVTEEMLTNEPRDLITKNLDLNIDELPEDYKVSFKSDNDAIIINEDTAYVTRDLYRDIPVTITATVSDGKTNWRNYLHYTVLRETTNVYMSENFYYPEGKGMILYDVPGIVRSETNTTPAMAGTYGWSTRYATDMTEETTAGKRFKSYLDMEGENYVLHSYRPLAMEEHNNTHYILGEKPTEDIILKYRVKFDNNDSTQIYVFKMQAIFIVNGEKRRVTINETNFRYNDGQPYTIYMPIHDGQKSTTLHLSKDNMPKEDEWADIEWRFYTDSYTIDLYVNDVKANPEPIPFWDVKDPELDRTQFVGYTDFDFNTYRGFGGGNLYMDDVSVTSNPQWYNKNPEIFYLYNNTDESTFTDEDASQITSDLEFVNHTMADYTDDKGVSVTYSSSEPDVISNDGKVTRVKYDTPVTITATFSKNGASISKDFEYTVLCDEEYLKISNIAKRINAEIFTKESVNHITKDFSLDYTVLSDIDFSDIDITFESSNPEILDVNSEKGKCIVTRPLEDTDVTITVSITQDGKNALIAKDLSYRVLSAATQIYYSDSFYYPENVGDIMKDINGIGLGVTTTNDSKYKVTLDKEKSNNHYVHTIREGTSGAQKFLQYKYPTTSQYKVAFEADIKIDHSATPQYYFFHMYGNYLLPDGTTQKAMIVDLNFFDEGYRTFVFTRRQDEKAISRSVTLLNEIPEKDKWFRLKVVVNTADHTADYYFDGVKVNDEPIGLYECTTRKGQYLYNVEDIRMTAFRTQAGELSIDNFAAYTLSGDVVANNAFYSNGERIQALEEALDGNVDLEVFLYNQTDVAQNVSVAMCEYQGEKLTNISVKSIALDTDNKTIEKLNFDDFELSENPENSVIKVFLWGKDNISPYVEEIKFKNELNREVISGEITCDITGRTYNWVDFNGVNMLRSYFTMQGWSADGTKFYVYDEDYKIFEYNTITSTVKYIDKCINANTVTTTPLNNLFYISKNKEIIRMNIDTYEKEVVGVIPEEYADSAGMLQVMDTEEKLSVEWTDKQLEEGSRFPVLDIATGEWDLSHSYVFETEWYDPNHVSINPEKPNLLMFCHEGTSVNDRLWVLNTDTDEYYNVFVSRFYSKESAGEIACHEMWTHDGEHILFHKSSGSSAIGYPGIVSIKYDGTDRNYINSDYSYNHPSTSPVSNRWAVSDTGYSNGEYSDIVLIDCYTGVSHHIARVRQTGVNPGHCHPGFSLDGNKVWFGLYDETGKIIRVGWADVSDIIANAPDGGWYDLSGSCDSFSYEGCDSEVEGINHNGQTLYRLPKGNIMRVNVKSEIAYQPEGDAKVSITYLDEGTGTFNFTYYTFEIGETRNRLVKNTKAVNCTGTGELKTVTFELNDICLDNMERLKTDFTITSSTDVFIKSVETELIN